MRRRLEDDLRMFGELAKQEQEEIESKKEEQPDQPGLDDELSSLAGAVDWHLSRAAKRQHTKLDTQQEIFDIQKTKQEVMNRLRERMACLDDPDCEPDHAKGSRSVEFDEGSKEFIHQGEPVSFSEIVTDLEWGIDYDLGKNDKARLATRKYYLEQAKDNLRDLLDQQITRSEVGSRDVHVWKKEAYQHHEEDRESGVDLKKSGIIAEKMVKNILKKASLDDDRLPFEVLDADIYQDVEEKIDFVIRHKERTRGVNVDAKDEVRDIAIQFSINPNAEFKKRKQVRRAKRQLMNRGDMDDLVLVVLPINFVQDLRRQWERDGRPAGGPDKLMNQAQAKELFRGVMKDVMPKKELNDTWSKVASRFSKVD